MSSLLLHSCSYQPFKQGKNLYSYYCSPCHLDDGSGLKSLYPPLANSDYLKYNQSIIPCIIKNGLSDTIVVNGKQYSNPMAAIPSLNEVEITNIINYINHSWGNEYGQVSVAEIKEQLENCQ